MKQYSTSITVYCITCVICAYIYPLSIFFQQTLPAGKNFSELENVFFCDGKRVRLPHIADIVIH